MKEEKFLVVRCRCPECETQAEGYGIDAFELKEGDGPALTYRRTYLNKYEEPVDSNFKNLDEAVACAVCIARLEAVGICQGGNYEMMKRRLANE